MKNLNLLLLASILIGLIFIVSIADGESCRDSDSLNGFGSVDTPEYGVALFDPSSVAN